LRGRSLTTTPDHNGVRQRPFESDTRNHQLPSERRFPTTRTYFASKGSGVRVPLAPLGGLHVSVRPSFTFGSDIAAGGVGPAWAGLAVTLGDAGTALDVARTVDLDRVAVTERKAAFFMDTARAFLQCRKVDKARRPRPVPAQRRGPAPRGSTGSARPRRRRAPRTPLAASSSPAIPGIWLSTRPNVSLNRRPASSAITARFAPPGLRDQ
jgi:hypothetical protein